MRRSSLWGILVLTIVLAAASSPAMANRLGVEAGGLIPFSSWNDRIDVSPYFGATFDIQDINPLGQMALLGVYLHAAYSPLTVDKETKDALENQGNSDTSASYFEGTIGLKAHAKTSPLFLSVQTGYAHFDAPGGGSKGGIAGGVGVGTAFGGPALHLTIEGRMNVAFMSEIDDLQFFTLTASLGFPF